MAIILEAKDDYTNLVLSDRERQLIYRVRCLLKDLPDEVLRTLNTLVEQQRGERWKDQLLLEYLYQSLGYMNAYPLQTNYTLDTVPKNSWDAVICLGAMIFALWGESILQTGESFSYSDNGLSLSISNAGQYQGLASSLSGSFENQVKNLKYFIRPNPASVIGLGGGGQVRIRSYAPRMWTYR